MLQLVPPTGNNRNEFGVGPSKRPMVEVAAISARFIVSTPVLAGRSDAAGHPAASRPIMSTRGSYLGARLTVTAV
jgi:hypothetical protein